MNVMKTLAQTTATLRAVSVEAKQLAIEAPQLSTTLERTARMSTSLTNALDGATLLRNVTFTGPHAVHATSLSGVSAALANESGHAARTLLNDLASGLSPRSHAASNAFSRISHEAGQAADALTAIRNLTYRP